MLRMHAYPSPKAGRSFRFCRASKQGPSHPIPRVSAFPRLRICLQTSGIYFALQTIGCNLCRLDVVVGTIRDLNTPAARSHQTDQVSKSSDSFPRRGCVSSSRADRQGRSPRNLAPPVSPTPVGWMPAHCGASCRPRCHLHSSPTRVRIAPNTWGMLGGAEHAACQSQPVCVVLRVRGQAFVARP